MDCGEAPFYRQQKAAQKSHLGLLTIIVSVPKSSDHKYFHLSSVNGKQ
jgi:hypothetical protein